MGAVNLHYSDAYTDMTYNDVLVRACAQAGIAAFTGDGTDPNVMTQATRAIAAAGGLGVPTIKPWDIDTIRAKMEQARQSGCFAVAMDVDAAGLPFLKNRNPPAGSKSVEELREIVGILNKPFIVKGIMTVKSALKAQEAGAAAIIVSNHGGRVLDQCPATAEVLPEIVSALHGSSTKILVDGGIRTGTDIFKALALGADAAVIARPRGRGGPPLHRKAGRRAGRRHADVRRPHPGRHHPRDGPHLQVKPRPAPRLEESRTKAAALCGPPLFAVCRFISRCRPGPGRSTRGGGRGRSCRSPPPEGWRQGRRA